MFLVFVKIVFSFLIDVYCKAVLLKKDKWVKILMKDERVAKVSTLEINLLQRATI